MDLQQRRHAVHGAGRIRVKNHIDITGTLRVRHGGFE